MFDAYLRVGFGDDQPDVGYSKCPGCPLRLPQEKVIEQIDHMLYYHPEIVVDRQREMDCW